jgi:hypothetical protein
MPEAWRTFRLMMIAVALFAAFFSFVSHLEQEQRARIYRQRAISHGLMERSSIVSVIQGGKAAGPDELARLNQLRSGYHAALRQKYESAAASPWEDVAPDPPAPVPLSGPGRRVDLHFEP